MVILDFFCPRVIKTNEKKEEGEEPSTKRHINNTAMKVGGSSLLCKSNQV